MINVETITYNGETHKVRVIAKNGKEFRVGDLELECCLMGEDCNEYLDDKARLIDETIAYYVGSGEFKEYGYDIANVPDDVLLAFIHDNIDADVMELLN